eukprot:CAMPEP_0176503060 /NCGR_PEP_ID=MMETSP0200_2-20121128/15121_1 /TAXON_ID=947934 /ORGANISM="Chaetoceros sp., Strain GSL56" /LENGTH=704 /DNA_ID=CAMNT_0017902245 /DNA_START=146 /DNA_END=2257 /DNA_ORIENTATION=+
MEYDRALYRVYERAMEGLIQTQPVLQLMTTATTSNTNANNNDNSGNSDTSSDIRNDEETQTRQGERRQERSTLPFFWPLFVIRLYDSLNRSSLVGSIRDKIPIMYRSWWNFVRRRRRSSSSRYVDVFQFSVLRVEEEEEEEVVAEQTGRGRDLEEQRGQDDHLDRGVELTNISQAFGMRRRNNSSSSSSSPSRDVMSSRLSSRNRQETMEGSTPSSDNLRRTEERMIENNISTTETTRLAQHIAERHHHHHHHHRHRLEQDMREEGFCSQRGFFVLMRICLVFAIFHLFVLWCLHNSYVGPIGIAKDKTSTADMGYYSTKMTCLEYALSTRPIEERNHFYNLHGEDFTSDGDGDDISGGGVKHKKDVTNNKNGTSDSIANTNETVLPLLNRNEILQIKIIYGNNCDGIAGQCSRAHTVILPANETVTQTTHKTSFVMNSIGFNWGKKTTSDNDSGGINKYATAAYWDKPAYRFSTSEALMFLDDKILFYHNVSIVNVTLSERCLVTGSDEGVYKQMWTNRLAQFLSPIYGMDEVIVNQVMYGIKTSKGDFRDGYLQNRETKKRWFYLKTQLEENRKVRKEFVSWLLNRIAVLIISFVAFFLITSVTALIVRLLTSSGVFILFPIFAAYRSWGVNGIDERMLDFSYPWIGRARRAIRAQNLHPMNHYVGAHIAKLFLVYTMYESCQIAWDSFLYSKSMPANLPLW